MKFLEIRSLLAYLCVFWERDKIMPVSPRNVSKWYNGLDSESYTDFSHEQGFLFP